MNKLMEYLFEWMKTNGYQTRYSSRSVRKYILKNYPQVTEHREETGGRKWYFKGLGLTSELGESEVKSDSINMKVTNRVTND